ncbi:MAG: Flp pilus assembly complex ATPase component TadA, partial [Desulfofustis sp.]|nr:Flp pilus assembly complex ATPase component TadA [Desulfofustis sp.]
MTGSERSHSYGEIVSVLLAEGVIDEKDAAYAERIRAKLTTPQPLLNILKDLKLVSDDTVRETLRKTKKSIRIGELLVELGYLSTDDLQTAFNIKQEEPDLKIGEILVKYNFVDNQLVNRILSIQLGYPLVQPSLAQVDRELFTRAPLRHLTKHAFIPLKSAESQPLVAFADPTDREAVRAAQKLFGTDLLVAICDRKELVDTLDSLQKSKGKSALTVDSQSVVGIVNSIILDAVQADASDIHIEPYADRLLIRFRQDGVLLHYQDYPREIIPSLVSRIKILCQADIAERRRHQGGRLLFEHPEGKIDIRASFYVTIHGEKVVLRLLRQKQELLDIRSIGLAPRMLARFLDEAVYQPSGVLLVTGPTGSGKTSTIYSCLHHIKNPQISSVTAEEPVEYVIDGVAQCSIDPSIGLTFEETLRHIVRQDPD